MICGSTGAAAATAVGMDEAGTVVGCGVQPAPSLKHIIINILCAL